MVFDALLAIHSNMEKNWMKGLFLGLKGFSWNGSSTWGTLVKHAMILLLSNSSHGPRWRCQDALSVETTCGSTHVTVVLVCAMRGYIPP